MAAITAGVVSASEPDPKELMDPLELNLLAQGSSLALLLEKVDRVLSESKTALRAPSPGCWAPEMGALRDLVVAHQGNAPETFGDACGFRIANPAGTSTRTGDALGWWRGTPAPHKLSEIFRPEVRPHNPRALEVVKAAR